VISFGNGKPNKVFSKRCITPTLTLNGKVTPKNSINSKVIDSPFILLQIRSISLRILTILDVQSWKETLESDDYDYEYIQKITQLLKEAREKDEFVKLIHIIRSNSMRNIGNILNAALFSQSYVGTKDLIEDFQQEVDESFYCGL
jgi:hypothetical protein